MNNHLKQQMHQSSGAWLWPRSRNQQAKPREGIGTSSQLPGQVKDSSSDGKIHLICSTNMMSQNLSLDLMAKLSTCEIQGGFPG